MEPENDYRRLILNILGRRDGIYQGVRKIVSGVTWQPFPVPKLSFNDLGYGPNKLKQLMRNYVDDAEFERVRVILNKRADQSFTSVAVSLRGKNKESRSMGWCMLSLVITRAARQPDAVEFHYRSTEVILKFGGDLVFAPVLFDELGIEPEKVTYRFANCFLSGVYFPYVCTWWDPIGFLEAVYERDLDFFKTATRFFLRSAYKKDQVFPFSPENVAHRFAWDRLGNKPMKRIRDYLEEKHKQFGKPLPKIHYAPGEYVPRGQRRKETNDD